MRDRVRLRERDGEKGRERQRVREREEEGEKGRERDRERWREGERYIYIIISLH